MTLHKYWLARTHAHYALESSLIPEISPAQICALYSGAGKLRV
jgi:hypothetical protein